MAMGLAFAIGGVYADKFDLHFLAKGGLTVWVMGVIGNLCWRILA